MRIVLALSLLALTAPSLAQDPGQQLQLQQAQMQLQQAQVQAQMQAQQQAILQQTLLMNQQMANQAAPNSLEGLQPGVARPSLSITPSPTGHSVIVRMKDRTRGTSLFYTTNGWTPTPASRRYEGPFELDHAATLRVVAIAPGALRSSVEVHQIVLPSALPAPAPVEALTPGTRIRLAFSAPVTSHTLAVGDSLPVTLAQDVTVHGVTLAPAGTPVRVTVSQVDHSGHGGYGGSIVFTARSLTLSNGEVLPLLGGEMQEAEPLSAAVTAAAIIPLAPIFIKGHEAIIPQGATFTARIAAPAPPSDPQ